MFEWLRKLFGKQAKARLVAPIPPLRLFTPRDLHQQILHSIKKPVKINNPTKIIINKAQFYPYSDQALPNQNFQVVVHAFIKELGTEWKFVVDYLDLTKPPEQLTWDEYYILQKNFVTRVIEWGEGDDGIGNPIKFIRTQLITKTFEFQDSYRDFVRSSDTLALLYVHMVTPIIETLLGLDLERKENDSLLIQLLRRLNIEITEAEALKTEWESRKETSECAIEKLSNTTNALHRLHSLNDEMARARERLISYCHLCLKYLLSLKPKIEEIILCERTDVLMRETTNLEDAVYTAFTESHAALQLHMARVSQAVEGFVITDGSTLDLKKLDDTTVADIAKKSQELQSYISEFEKTHFADGVVA